MHDERKLMAVTFTDTREPLREVEVLVAPVVPAEELLAGAVTLSLDGTPVRVVSLVDLIAMKRASERRQADADAAVLERIHGEHDATWRTARRVRVPRL